MNVKERKKKEEKQERKIEWKKERKKIVKKQVESLLLESEISLSLPHFPSPSVMEIKWKFTFDFISV